MREGDGSDGGGGGGEALPTPTVLLGIIMRIIQEIFMCIDGWKGFCEGNLVTRCRANDPLPNLDFLSGHVGPCRGRGTAAGEQSRCDLLLASQGVCATLQETPRGDKWNGQWLML